MLDQEDVDGRIEYVAVDITGQKPRRSELKTSPVQLRSIVAYTESHPYDALGGGKMHIKHIEISNFRKLRAVRVDFSDEKTVFVGANNSGKTSAMVALRRFLVDDEEFAITDFTLSHWKMLNASADEWEKAVAAGEPMPSFDWAEFLPAMDVWLSVATSELHHVRGLIPTLNWTGGTLGVRLRLEPKDPAVFQREYLKARDVIKDAVVPDDAEFTITASPAHGPLTGPENAASGASESVSKEINVPITVALWPQSMTDFLERRLRSYFKVQAYLLDPAKLAAPAADGVAAPQTLPQESHAIEGDPFDGLIRIDEISAQRGFGHSSSSRSKRSQDEQPDAKGGRRLSAQLRSYYTNHLDPTDRPGAQDLRALAAIEQAQSVFDARLQDGFSEALRELEDLNYPGVTDPKLTISTRIKPTDGLNHDAAVQYEVASIAGEITRLRLPEDSNGLGYQNLVSMVFGLMGFRDAWMRVGKAEKESEDISSRPVPPLHLVLVEEPEAHLHAQVQQVFIKQAYSILRKHKDLGKSKTLTTQMVVSTHSSHVAHECDFSTLRYFRRMPASDVTGSVPYSLVINLSEVFGTIDDTKRFVARYLKATHCDLFFADAAILIEGPAERIVVPHLVQERKEYEALRKCYITWLEIGGSHAHRLRDLIEHLGLTTLIITDIDATNPVSKGVAQPARGAGQIARNETLKGWIPGTDDLDSLLTTDDAGRTRVYPNSFSVRVAYQQPVTVPFKKLAPAEAVANTFEDALLYQNLETFEKLGGTGLIAKFRKAIADSANLTELGAKVFSIFEKIRSGEKAEFALEILMLPPATPIVAPAYVDDGLKWLSSQLERKLEEISLTPVTETKKAA